MTGWRLTVGFVVFLLALQTESKKVIFCKPGKNEHFIQQIGKCKKCDRCPRGWGYDTNEEVAMDPVHGALSCKGCVKCTPGVTFSKFINYGPCRQCKNCTAIGLRYIRPCAVEINAKCGEPLPPPPTKQQIQRKESHDIKKPREKEYVPTANEDLTSFKTVFFGTILSAVFLMALVSTVVFVCRKRKRAFQAVPRGNTVDEAERNVRGEQNNADVQTCVEMLQTQTALRGAVGVDDMCQEPFLDQSSKLDEDGVPHQEAHSRDRILDWEWDKSIPTDAMLQRLCPQVAANNLYRRAGRLLGVPDNHIEIIKEEARGDTKECAFQTLKKWKELNGKEATTQRLRKVLYSIGRKDLADKTIASCQD